MAAARMWPSGRTGTSSRATCANFLSSLPSAGLARSKANSSPSAASCSMPRTEADALYLLQTDKGVCLGLYLLSLFRLCDHEILPDAGERGRANRDRGTHLSRITLQTSS